MTCQHCKDTGDMHGQGHLDCIYCDVAEQKAKGEKMEAKHTATPWNTIPNDGPLAIPGTGYLHNVIRIEGRVIKVIAENVEFEDAVFIKRACNAHDDLVKALKSALETAEFEKHPFRSWQDEARAALSKAGAA